MKNCYCHLSPIRCYLKASELKNVNIQLFNTLLELSLSSEEPGLFNHALKSVIISVFLDSFCHILFCVRIVFLNDICTSFLSDFN